MEGQNSLEVRRIGIRHATDDIMRSVEMQRTTSTTNEQGVMKIHGPMIRKGAFR